MTALAPNVGDKVVYCGHRTDGKWADRRATPGQVVEVDRDEQVSVRVWAPGEGEWWGALTSSVRVVERATYTAVDRRAEIIAAAEELTEARRIIADLNGGSLDPASVSDHAGDVDGAVRDYEAHAADALARLGRKDGAS